MGFKKFVKNNLGLVVGAPIVAAAFVLASQGGKNIPALDEAYDTAKDKICVVLDLDCAQSTEKVNNKPNNAPAPSN